MFLSLFFFPHLISYLFSFGLFVFSASFAVVIILLTFCIMYFSHSFNYCYLSHSSDSNLSHSFFESFLRLFLMLLLLFVFSWLSSSSISLQLFLPILCMFSLIFTLWSAGTAKSMICQDFSILLTIITFGLLAWIGLSVCTSMSHRSLWLSFSSITARLCLYHLSHLFKMQHFCIMPSVLDRVYSCIRFGLVCCIHLCGLLFRFFIYRVYICYFFIILFCVAVIRDSVSPV